MSDRLNELRARLNAHPFWTNRFLKMLTTGVLGREDLRYVFGQNFLYVKSMGRGVAYVAAKFDDGPRALLSRELWEDSGAGDPQKRFAERFRGFLREALDVADPDAGPFADPTQRFVHETLAGCRREDLNYALASLIYGHMAPTPRVREAHGQALRAAKVDERHLGLFSVATTPERLIACEGILASLSDRPGWFETCAAAMDESLAQRDRYFESLADAVLKPRVDIQ